MSQDFQLARSQNGGGKRTLVVEILFQHTTDLQRQKGGREVSSQLKHLSTVESLTVSAAASRLAKPPGGSKHAGH